MCIQINSMSWGRRDVRVLSNLCKQLSWACDCSAAMRPVEKVTTFLTQQLEPLSRLSAADEALAERRPWDLLGCLESAENSLAFYHLVSRNRTKVMTGKGKVCLCHTPKERWRGAHLSDYVFERDRWKYHYYPWRMASVMLDLTPVPNYTAWWQRHMCVNNLPRVALDRAAPAGIRTRDLRISSPTP